MLVDYGNRMQMANLLPRLLSGQVFRETVNSLPGRWQHLPPYIHLYAVLLILAGLLFQLTFPIALTDSDMWYHMDAGRFFWQQGRIPDNAFFSFIAPEREFVNYYWGFQALVARIYEFTGYQGLIVLRALLFTFSALVVYRYILVDKTGRGPLFALLLLFIAYFTFIEGRLPNLRPHLFSHLFILMFLYILERKPRWAPALPILTLAWVNIHGIEYPVPLLIGGAYFIELVYLRFFSAARNNRPNNAVLIWLLTCLPALLLTPHGLALFATPFEVATQVAMYIDEMKPLDSRALYSLVLNGANLKIESIFPIAFLFSGYAFVRSALDNRLRLSHAILALGGYFLLLRGNRFLWEWALLVLPLLTHFVSGLQTRQSSRPLFSLSHLLAGVIMVMPVVSLVNRVPTGVEFPFDTENTPEGITRFLAKEGKGGKLYAPPTSAGYLHWKLYPDYKIFADLQMSLFTDLDIYTMFSFYRDVNGTAKTLAKYQPEFISANKKNDAFRKVAARLSGYVPVFTDDMQILFANSELLPELVEEHQLKRVDPYSLAKLKPDTGIDEHLAELNRMLDIYPEGDRLNHAVTRLLVDAKRYAEAEQAARRYLHYRPTSPNGHMLLGDILKETAACAEAMAHYRLALQHADDKFKKKLFSRLGNCAYTLEDFETAYDYLNQAINPFSDITSNEDLYQLAFSAYVLGEQEQAMLLLDMIIHSTPLDKPETVQEAMVLLQIVKEQGATPSFLSWLLGGLRSPE